ncbi:Serine/threonine protein kinase [Parasponia andersonii]|uniref:Receptor-like serine/threonine-protein kinase n=1 Tax=Parasponia andersonii TaxID=3476 RepID=A0A2P5DYQ3_PARAD|nr:Serine/threonine protein kinase [Parasponia andersonii]
MDTVKILAFPFLVNIFCCFWFCKSYASDTLVPGETLGGNQTLVSPLGVFELGFFPNGKVPKQYLGIWLKNDKYKKPVWVANQDSPLVDNSAILYIRDDGNLVISDVRGLPSVVNNGRAAPSSNTSCMLLDSGNLVLMEGENMFWQSFDSPTDTYLPGMKLGWFNLDTDHIRKQFLVSWLTPLDPTKGNFLFGVDTNDISHLKIWRSLDAKSQPIGFWGGQNFSFYFQTKSKDYNFSFFSSSKEIYFTFSNNGNTSVPSSWFELAPNGDINELIMVGKEISIVNHSPCQGTLAANSTKCLTVLPSLCWNGDKFTQIKGTIPDSMTVDFPARMGLSDCELTCESNCSCTAYSSYNGDSNMCLLYFGGNKDLQRLGRGNQSIYVRGDAKIDSNRWKTVNLLLKILVPIMSSLILFIVIIFFCCLRKRKSNRIGIEMSQSGLRKSLKLFSVFSGSNAAAKDREKNDQELNKEDIHELPQLSFSSIAESTDNFSFSNKLGEGGFGPVYKGKLLGHEIAVKRLSKSSGQGFEEFKNEVQLISELQHRNLVKLLGYSIHEEEKILVYEYMANKSLDAFIFDKKRGTLLDWGQRMHIIEGIAQGLLYLHKFSRLRVIHRDLKTSNILLDSNMNPKISDFGMARICHENESQGITRRVVGTYGYMSPEYAVHGHFSTKSDVFSYGVILLEIVSGRKNTSTFEYVNRKLSLLGYAWNLWKDDRSRELLDPTLANSCRMKELQLCIEVALLCVQENPEDRPGMSDVISMLGNERSVLPTPMQPALSTYMSLTDIDSPRRLQRPSQINVTISSVEAR